jgi:glycosyltransferase involved in cell wall biosynthesis
MIAFVAAALMERNFEPVVAHYEPFSLRPSMSVPCYALFSRGIGVERRTYRDGIECHAVGAWLPEFEFTHYYATAPWRALIESCDYHIAVTGNVLTATALLQTHTPYLAWVSAGWNDDRKDRAACFPPVRRAVDRFINAPVITRLERRLLANGHIVANSKYTAAHLDSLVGSRICRGTLPVPIDTENFRPDAEAVVPGRIGFSGRLSDPRKNVSLLLAAATKLVSEGNDITVDLIGVGREEMNDLISSSSPLASRLNITPYLAREDLAGHLAKLDVCVVSSHQEGLCIAALEAMACGCPVVSTRCGGPEEFVIDNETGFVVDFSIAKMADRIKEVVDNRDLRSRLSQGARARVADGYTVDRSKGIFWRHFEAAFAAAP